MSAEKGALSYLNSLEIEENKDTKMKQIGVTTFINSLAKNKDNHWKKTSGRFRKRYSIDGKGSKLSYMHDSYITLQDILYKVLCFTYIDKEVEFKHEKIRVIHNGEVKILRGFVDILLKQKDGKIAILDIKTTKAESFSLMEAVLKQKNELQLRLYAYLVMKVYKLSYIPPCYICGIHLKKKCQITIWDVPLDLKEFNSIEEVLSIWPETYRTPKLPDIIM